MEPPIITNDNGDILVFSTKTAAEEYMEPVDVLNRVYEVFDRCGFLYPATVQDDRSHARRSPHVLIGESPLRQDRDYMVSVLRRFLQALGIAQDETRAWPLEDLITEVARRQEGAPR